MNSTDVVSTHTAPAPSRTTILDLAERRTSNAISVLMPPTPRDEARIVIRNLVNDVELRLEAAGMRSVEARELATEVERTVDDHDFWAPPEVSIAVYVVDGTVYRLAGPAFGHAHAVVGPRAQIKHLVDCVPHPEHAVLALSLKSANLFQSSEGGLVEIENDALPVTMADVLRYDDVEHQLQYRIAGKAGQGRSTALFHGHGTEGNREEDVLRYLRAVDAATTEVLDGRPLVLAATEELAAAYRRVTGYGNVLAEEIGGSGERRTLAELRIAAQAIVAGAAVQHREDVRGQIEERMLTGDVAVDLREVVLAACEGRVEAVFVAGNGVVINGYHEPEHRSVELATDGEDLINLAAIETWRRGGEVFVVPGQEMPAGEPAVALLRY